MTVTKDNLDNEISKLIKTRDEKGNKGTFGTLTAFCGCDDYIGCATLACSAALRVGCGIVRLTSTETVCKSAVTYCPEITLCVDKSSKGHIVPTDELIDKALNKASAVLVGCGMGVSFDTYSVVKATVGKSIPHLYDADALNSVAKYREDGFCFGNDTVITPHIGEMARLTGLSPDEIKANRLEIAKDFAKKNEVVLVLKDYITVITDGDRLDVLDIQNSGMSKGGSGDVLGGIISSLLAQGYMPYEAALLGVMLHSKAGLIAKEKFGRASMLPSDLIGLLP